MTSENWESVPKLAFNILLNNCTYRFLKGLCIEVAEHGYCYYQGGTARARGQDR